MKEKRRAVSEGFPAKGVGMWVKASGPSIIANDAPSRFLGWVSEDTGILPLTALASGRYTVVVEVRGRTGGSVADRVDLQVEAREAE